MSVASKPKGHTTLRITNKETLDLPFPRRIESYQINGRWQANYYHNTNLCAEGGNRAEAIGNLLLENLIEEKVA